MTKTGTQLKSRRNIIFTYRMADGSTKRAPTAGEAGDTERPGLRLVEDTGPEYLRPLLEGETAFDGDVVTITEYVSGEVVSVRKMVMDWDALEGSI